MEQIQDWGQFPEELEIYELNPSPILNGVGNSRNGNGIYCKFIARIKELIRIDPMFFSTGSRSGASVDIERKSVRDTSYSETLRLIASSRALYTCQ